VIDIGSLRRVVKAYLKAKANYSEILDARNREYHGFADKEWCEREVRGRTVLAAAERTVIETAIKMVKIADGDSNA
jgi:hypothetical protein